LRVWRRGNRRILEKKKKKEVEEIEEGEGFRGNTWMS